MAQISSTGRCPAAADDVAQAAGDRVGAGQGHLDLVSSFSIGTTRVTAAAAALAFERLAQRLERRGIGDHDAQPGGRIGDRVLELLDRLRHQLDLLAVEPPVARKSAPPVPPRGDCAWRSAPR
jgi:hypothetical protein